jgi:hypothetical protein
MDGLIGLVFLVFVKGEGKWEEAIWQGEGKWEKAICRPDL